MSNIVDIQGQPLELEDFSPSYASRLLAQLEQTLRQLEGCSPGERAFATVRCGHRERRFNEYLDREAYPRLHKMQMEVRSYLRCIR